MPAPLIATRSCADERLVEAGCEQVAVRHVPPGRSDLEVTALVNLVVRLTADEELELGAHHRLVAQLAGALDLPAQHLPRRLGDRCPVVPAGVGEHERRLRMPGHPPQRREVGVEREVGIADVDARHRVSGRGVGLHVERQEGAAHVDRVRRALDEVVALHALAHQAALHVDEREDDALDRPVPHLGLELLEAQRPGGFLCRRRHVRAYPRSNIRRRS